MIFAVFVLYSVRSVLACRFRFWHPIVWLAALAALGAAGYMEYYVQRHGNEYLFAYAVMCAGLGVFCIAVFALFLTSRKRARPEPETPGEETPSEGAENEGGPLPC